jgi:hypothetical protein
MSDTFWILAALTAAVVLAAICSEKSRRGRVLFCYLLHWHRTDGPVKLLLGEATKICPRCGRAIELDAHGRLHRDH